ncbi:MAG: hypothetical protein KTR31_24490 [Myxococcales bacterium]|nr:hypothetical protein [Myxococcales bacterium]
MNIFMLGALAVAPSAHAQDEEAAEEVSVEDRIARALELPNVAESLRQKGVEPDQVEGALQAAKDQGMRADEAAEALEETDKAVEEHGSVDNFGTFVRGLLDQGLRGRELAAAIRAEHQARGKGPRKGMKGKVQRAQERYEAGEKGRDGKVGKANRRKGGKAGQRRDDARRDGGDR